jgi:hypothetical protein
MFSAKMLAVLPRRLSGEVVTKENSGQLHVNGLKWKKP